MSPLTTQESMVGWINVNWKWPCPHPWNLWTDYLICAQWQPTPVESHGRRSLVDCSPWGRKESDTTEQLHFHFSLSCIGEGNGNPLQCSCLESPRDRGAWRAAFYAVAQNWTQLKRLSSSSSICQMDIADVNKLRTRWGYYSGQVGKMKLQGSI